MGEHPCCVVQPLTGERGIGSEKDVPAPGSLGKLYKHQLRSAEAPLILEGHMHRVGGWGGTVTRAVGRGWRMVGDGQVGEAGESCPVYLQL